MNIQHDLRIACFPGEIYIFCCCFSFPLKTGPSFITQFFFFGNTATRELVITKKQYMLLTTSTEPLNALGNKMTLAGASIIVSIEY